MSQDFDLFATPDVEPFRTPPPGTFGSRAHVALEARNGIETGKGGPNDVARNSADRSGLAERRRDSLVLAVLALHDLTDAIAAVKRTWERCEPVAKWRNQLYSERAGDGDGLGSEPKPCAKEYPLRDDVDMCTGETSYRQITDPQEVAEHITDLWCGACQRNSPKVLEWKRLRRKLGAAKGRVTRAVRAYRAAMEAA